MPYRYIYHTWNIWLLGHGTAFCSLHLECFHRCHGVPCPMAGDKHDSQRWTLSHLCCGTQSTFGAWGWPRVEGLSSKRWVLHQKAHWKYLMISSEVNQRCGFPQNLIGFRQTFDIWFTTFRRTGPPRSADPDEDPKQFCKMEPHELECAGVDKARVYYGLLLLIVIPK